MQHVPGNSAQGNLQPATPWSVRLAGIGTDVDVNKSLAGGTLNEGPSKVWQLIVAAGLRGDAEFELEIAAF